MAERNQKEMDVASYDEGDLVMEEALQVALDQASKEVVATLNAYKTANRSYQTTKKAAEQAQSGDVWRNAYGVRVREHLAGLEEELMARFSDWAKPDTVDAESVAASFQALIEDAAPAPASAPLPVPPPPAPRLIPVEPAVPAVQPAVDMDIVSTTESIRERRGLNAKHMGSITTGGSRGFS
jgi:hypothetical protein